MYVVASATRAAGSHLARPAPPSRRRGGVSPLAVDLIAERLMDPVDLANEARQHASTGASAARRIGGWSPLAVRRRWCGPTRWRSGRPVGVHQNGTVLVASPSAMGRSRSPRVQRAGVAGLLGVEDAAHAADRVGGGEVVGFVEVDPAGDRVALCGGVSAIFGPSSCRRPGVRSRTFGSSNSRSTAPPREALVVRNFSPVKRVDRPPQMLRMNFWCRSCALPPTTSGLPPQGSTNTMAWRRSVTRTGD
jgi:hypothetical protein